MQHGNRVQPRIDLVQHAVEILLVEPPAVHAAALGDDPRGLRIDGHARRGRAVHLQPQDVLPGVQDVGEVEPMGSIPDDPDLLPSTETTAISRTGGARSTR